MIYCVWNHPIGIARGMYVSLISWVFLNPIKTETKINQYTGPVYGEQNNSYHQKSTEER